MGTATIDVVDPDKTQTHELTVGLYLLGRTDAADIQLSDALVSSQHALLSVGRGCVMYRDLGSKNGSYWTDGERIGRPTVIAVGQSIVLGACKLTLRGIR